VGDESVIDALRVMNTEQVRQTGHLLAIRALVGWILAIMVLSLVAGVFLAVQAGADSGF